MYHCFAMTFVHFSVPLTVALKEPLPSRWLKSVSVNQKKNAKKSHGHDHHDGRGPYIGRDGQFTCFISTRTSCRKLRSRFGYAPSFPAGSISENPLDLDSALLLPGFFVLRLPSSLSVLASPAYPPAVHRPKTGRGGGIRTPTLGFGDRWSTVEPTPLNPSDDPLRICRFAPPRLLHFLVRGVFPARIAELLRFQPVRYAFSGSWWWCSCGFCNRCTAM